METQDEDILAGKAAIMASLKIGRRVFAQFVAEGMPVDRSGKRYRAHKATLLAWFAQRTQQATAAA